MDDPDLIPYCAAGDMLQLKLMHLSVRMLDSQHNFPCLHYLPVQLLSFVSPSLILVGWFQVGHTAQRVRMLSSERNLPYLCHLHVQVLSYTPSSLVEVG